MLLNGEVTDGDQVLIRATSEVSETLEFTISR
jgi:ribosomal protein S17